MEYLIVNNMNTVGNDIVKTVTAIDTSLADYLELPKELITTNTEEA